MQNQSSILIIGNEILSGRVGDTNSGYLCRELGMIGLPAAEVVTVGDRKEDIERAMRDLRQRSLLTLVSGGLGPTEDDLTMESAAAVLGVELAEDPAVLADIENFFRLIGREMAPVNRKQALVPRGSKVLRNPVGTAPGIWDQRDQRHLVLLPGVPRELKTIFESRLRRELAAELNPGVHFHSRNFRTVGAGESNLQQTFQGLSQGWDRVWINTIARPMEVEVIVSGKGADPDETRLRVESASEQVFTAIKPWVYTRGSDPLEVVVFNALRRRGWTLAVAESCTGGELGARITDVAGSSEVFLGGVTAYSNEAKVKFLGVDENILREFGAVSEPVAAALARGARERFGADVGAGITGIAGPGGGSAEKPVGLVFIGVDAPGLDRPKVRKLNLPRDRKWIKSAAAIAALEMIRRTVISEP